MFIKYPEIGICGLSCRLCPMFNTQTSSKCQGCKSQARIALGCPFITCAVKKKGIEFCWNCPSNESCEKWSKHRQEGIKRDSFKCYQKLEEDIDFIRTHGAAEFEKEQKIRESLLSEMLQKFNDGRSKSYYCIASTVLKIEELREALANVEAKSKDLPIKEKAKMLHSILDSIAAKRNYLLKLRK